MNQLLEKSIDHERHNRQQRRAAEITTHAMAEVVGPTSLAVAVSECKTASEQVGYLTAAYTQLWLAYSRLAVRAGEVESLAEQHDLE